MNIHESAEDYLEAILILRERQGTVRSIDVVHQLELTKPSVSVAMKHLREKKHISVDGSGFITLTASGREIAEMIYERHTFLSGWLISLGVDETIAAEAPCRMEHVISKESFAAIKKYVADENNI